LINVLRTSVDKHLNLGFTLSERLLRRYLAKKLTDVDWSDDLALTSDTVENVSSLLHHLENAAKDIGLMSMLKTEHISTVSDKKYSTI